jgi:hypothetical protein
MKELALSLGIALMAVASLPLLLISPLAGGITLIAAALLAVLKNR